MAGKKGTWQNAMVFRKEISIFKSSELSAIVEIYIFTSKYCIFSILKMAGKNTPVTGSPPIVSTSVGF